MRWYFEKGEEFFCMTFDEAKVEISNQAGLVEALRFGSLDEAVTAMQGRAKPFPAPRYMLRGWVVWDWRWAVCADCFT